MKNPWKKLSGVTVYDNAWIRVEEHQVITPRNKQGLYGKVSFKNRAVGIVPLDNERNTWLVGQYRYTLNEYSWEIPMGGCPMEENLLDSAKRELKEETGLTAESWTNIMKIHTSNSVTDEVGYVYLAELLTEGATAFDDTEDLKIKKIPFTEALSLVMQGVITDAISIAAIFKTAFLLDQNQ